MKTFWEISVILFMNLLILVSCSKDGVSNNGSNADMGNGSPIPTITIDESSVTFDENVGEKVVSFASSADWTAEVINDRASEWLSLSPNKGVAGESKITIKVKENTTTDERSASVCIKSGTTQQTINVTQKQKDALTVTSSIFEVGCDGGEVLIEIKANIDYEYEVEESAQEWVTYLETRSMATSTLAFIISPNDDVERREAKIIIKAGELNEEITIYQTGVNPSIVISNKEVYVQSSGESISISVASNVDVSFNILGDVTWIVENKARATSTNTYIFDVLPNEGYDMRKAEIWFGNNEKNIYELVTISQMQKNAIVVSEEGYNVNGFGDKIELEIGHNVDFDIIIDCDWISLVDTKALASTNLVFNIAKNNTDNPREGTIKFISTDSSICQTIMIYQDPVAISKLRVGLHNTEDIAALRSKSKELFGDHLSEIIKEDEYTYTLLLEDYTEVPQFGMCLWIKSVDILEGFKSIGPNAFYDCWKLESVKISEGITYIGDNAFSCCYKLSSVNIPDGVSSIGQRAFSATLISEITIPESVEHIGGNVLGGCSQLKAIYGKYTSSDNKCLIIDGVLTSFAPSGMTTYEIPSETTEIGEGCFECMDELLAVSIPEGVKKIGNKAFYGCSNLAEVNIPNSVTSIGESAFQSVSVKEIVIHDNVTYLGNYAFIYSRLKRVTIGNGINSISEGTFAFSLLESVTIPDHVESIESSAFSGCSKLKNINLGTGLAKIGERAFLNCISLKEVIIPDTILSIEKSSFEGCEALESVKIGNGVTSISEKAFNECKSLKEVIIPDTILSIEKSSFEGCEALESVKIGNGVTIIGEKAFYECVNLKDLVIGDNVTTIYSSAFEYSGITDLKIPDKVRYLGNNAFRSCPLENVIVGKGVEEIVGEVFANTFNLTNIYFKPITPPRRKEGGDIFWRHHHNFQMFVPAESYDIYITSSDWDDYADFIVVDPTEN